MDTTCRQKLSSLVLDSCPKMGANLTLSTLGKSFIRQHFEIFFFKKTTGFDNSCKLCPMETVCMKCLILFCVKNKKKIICLLN